MQPARWAEKPYHLHVSIFSEFWESQTLGALRACTDSNAILLYVVNMYALYAVYAVRCMLYTMYAVYDVWGMLYMLYAIYVVCCNALYYV